ncbi:MAG: PAS domain S-box protein [Nitriliruptoraceae bacterium]
MVSAGSQDPGSTTAQRNRDGAAARLIAAFHAAVIECTSIDDILAQCWSDIRQHCQADGMALIARQAPDATGHAKDRDQVIAAVGEIVFAADAAEDDLVVDLEVDREVHRFDLPGDRLAAVLVAGHLSPSVRAVIPALGSMIDIELRRQDVEHDLHERVKELEALRAVQVAVESFEDLPSLCQGVAEAVARGMQFPDVARAELQIDGQLFDAGAHGHLEVVIAAEVTAAGLPRGELRVGYIVERPVLEPEEPDLVRACVRTLALHLAAADARRDALALAQRLRQVLDGLPSAIFTIDRDLKGLPVTLAEGFPVEHLPPVDQPLTESTDPVIEHGVRLARAGLVGESRCEEVFWQERWWEVRVDPQIGDDGEVEQVVMSVLDITHQKERLAAEAKLAALVGSASLAIVGLDLDGAVTSWNRGACDLTGWSPEDVIGTPIAAIEAPAGRGRLADGGAASGPDDLNGLASADAPTDSGTSIVPRRLDALQLSGQTGDRFEARLRHKHGHELYVAAYLSLILDSVGTPVGALMTCEDLTRHQQMVDALEESEAQFRLIGESVGDVVYRMSLPPSPRFEYVSPSAERVLGCSPLHLLNDPSLMVERSHPADIKDVQDHLAGRGSTIRRWRWRHEDGSWRWIEDHRSVLEREGEPVAIVGIIRDVTADHEATEATRVALANAERVADELRQVDMMKSTFLAAVSHELRTPLTSILGFSATLERLLSGSDDQELLAYVDRLMFNATRLEQLVDDLLDVDRLTRGQITPQPTPTDLAEMVRKVLRRNDDVTHQVTVDLEDVVIEVDAVMIERVVANLVRNVRRHTPPGTHTWITLRATSNGVRIVVDDDGPGIAVEDRQRIFEPFEQGELSAISASPGTGIGLSLVQRFVEAHGGQVATSERPGGGARFSVDLPGGAAGAVD